MSRYWSAGSQRNRRTRSKTWGSSSFTAQSTTPLRRWTLEPPEFLLREVAHRALFRRGPVRRSKPGRFFRTMIEKMGSGQSRRRESRHRSDGCGNHRHLAQALLRNGGKAVGRKKGIACRLAPASGTRRFFRSRSGDASASAFEKANQRDAGSGRRVPRRTRSFASPAGRWRASSLGEIFPADNAGTPLDMGESQHVVGWGERLELTRLGRIRTIPPGGPSR